MTLVTHFLADIDAWGVLDVPNTLVNKAVATSKTILLVDDDMETRALFRYILQSEGFSVVVSKTSDEIPALIESKNIDCIVSYVMMYSPDRLDFVTTLREKTSREMLPLILLADCHEELENELLLEKADMLCLKREARRRLACQIRYLLY